MDYQKQFIQFIKFIEEGELEEIQSFYEKYKQYIDISALNEEAFRYACGNGHLKVVLWLYKIKPTINIYADN